MIIMQGLWLNNEPRYEAINQQIVKEFHKTRIGEVYYNITRCRDRKTKDGRNVFVVGFGDGMVPGDYFKKIVKYFRDNDCKVEQVWDMTKTMLCEECKGPLLEQSVYYVKEKVFFCTNKCKEKYIAQGKIENRIIGKMLKDIEKTTC